MRADALEETAVKINMIKFYKTSITVFGVISLIIIAASVAFAILFQTSGAEGVLMLLFGIFAGIMCLLFPILLNGRQLTRVLLSADKAEAYSFLGRKLCSVDFGKEVFSAPFDVRFPYAPPVKFIAVSNETFADPKQSKRFYGTYDRKKIIIFPYDEQTAQFINTESRNKSA